MKCSLQTCPSTASSHLTSCSRKFAKQATISPDPDEVVLKVALLLSNTLGQGLLQTPD